MYFHLALWLGTIDEGNFLQQNIRLLDSPCLREIWEAVFSCIDLNILTKNIGFPTINLDIISNILVFPSN